MVKPFALCSLLTACTPDFSQWDAAGYKLPGDCAVAEQMAAGIPVKAIDHWDLAKIAGRQAWAATQYKTGADGLPIRSTVVIYMSDKLAPTDARYASILCHEKFHAILGAWHK